MIKKLSLIFGSKTKVQEILLLQNKLKHVVRQGFFESELPKVEKYCNENKIHLVKSRFKVLLADDGPFSNKGIRIPETDKRPGMFFVYLSLDEEKAWLAAYHEMMDNSQELGKSLGYPECCIKFFMENFSKDNPNPELAPKNPWTNLSKRNEDCVLLSHFPCSSECKQSMVMGRENLDLITKLDKPRAREMMELLWL